MALDSLGYKLRLASNIGKMNGEKFFWTAFLALNNLAFVSVQEKNVSALNST